MVVFWTFWPGWTQVFTFGIQIKEITERISDMTKKKKQGNTRIKSKLELKSYAVFRLC